MTNPPPLSVEEILALDAEYRAAADSTLERVAPRERNPTGEAWLPVMRRRLARGAATLSYSNTARAHQLGKTHDWVVLRYRETDGRETRCTIVTEWRAGALQGKRVVRRRERETLEYYRGPEAGAPHPGAQPCGS